VFALTSQGSAYGRFRRALVSGNEILILAAAKELPRTRSMMRFGSASSSATATRTGMSAPRYVGSAASRWRRAMSRSTRSGPRPKRWTTFKSSQLKPWSGYSGCASLTD
jgi:hypothetical protein